MNVTVVVGGKFHAFNLAEQLEKKGYLLKLITSYPACKINKNFNLKKNKTTTIIFKEVVERLILFLKLEKYLGFLFFYLNKYFEYFSSKKIDYKNSSIIVGWSGFSYKTFVKAKNYNILKILERGSSHIQFQSEILSEEYKIFNIEYKIEKKFIEQELKEYSLADYISVPSNFSKKTFLEKGFKDEKIIVTPYGVDLIDFFPKTKIDKTFRFIYVGQISFRKGSLYTLKAFQELNLPESELMMIGHCEYKIKPFLKEYEKNKRIKFISHVKQADLINYYNNSDVFVISSIEDGFAMVILQALACGLPVICTPNSGGSELIRNEFNGYVVPIRNINELKKKMNMLYQDKQQLTLLKKNIKKQKNFLSWDNYGNKIEKVYKSLLKTC
jgi:glycosyltransferase involved in cell wall biosynthesis